MPNDPFWDIPDEYLTEIGRVTIRWARLEVHVELALMKLSGLQFQDSRSHVLFLHMNFTNKMHALEALFNELSQGPCGESLKSYKAIITALQQAQQERNKIVHHLWKIDEGRLYSMGLSARGKLKSHSSEVTIELLQVISVLIATASEGLFKLMDSPNGTPQLGQ